MSTANESEKAARLKEAALAVLQGSGGSLNIVLTNKALFFADLVALRDLGGTITKSTYIALEHGPVVAKYLKRLIDALQRTGLARSVSVGDARPLVLTASGREFQRHVLLEEEWNIAHKIGDIFSGATSTFASRFSHDNPGWRIANLQRIEKGIPQPIDMLVALQDDRLYDPEGPASDDSQLLEDFESSEAGALLDWE